MSHEVKFKVGFHVEYLENLIQHLPVLTRGDYDRLEFVRLFSELENYGSHLDCVWPRTKNDPNSFPHQGRSALAHFRIATCSSGWRGTFTCTTTLQPSHRTRQWQPPGFFLHPYAA